MANFCGIAKTECPRYCLGFCGKEPYDCGNQIVSPDSEYSEIEAVTIRYMGKILANQEKIMKALDELNQKIK